MNNGKVLRKGEKGERLKENGGLGATPGEMCHKLVHPCFECLVMESKDRKQSGQRTLSTVGKGKFSSSRRPRSRMAQPLEKEGKEGLESK